ncbi:unnamed protein product [Caenorhabditis sp. 36 PRJEB53466]|nr:unnamed protein product [Caenorhabditis sp. 36 PRJEB53466]
MIVVLGSDILLKTLHVLWLFSLGSILVNCAKKKAEKGLEKTDSQQSLAKSGAKTPKKKGTTSGSAKNEDEEDDVQFNLKLKPAEQKHSDKSTASEDSGRSEHRRSGTSVLGANEKMNNNSCYVKSPAVKTMETNQSKCASPDQMVLQTSLLLRINVLFMCTLALLTFFLTYRALFILKRRPIFHKSTKILLYTSLVFVNVHEIIFMIIQSVALVRSFTLQNEPCEIMRTTLECKFQNHVLIFGIAAINFNQFGLTIDRLLATVIPQAYSKMGSLPGILLALVVFASAVAAPLVIAIGDPYDDIVPNCFFFPQHSAPKANIFLIILSVLVIMSILFNFIIIFVNKKLEKSTRFYVAQRYQKREALISTRIVSYIAASQFLGLALYSTIVLTLRLHKDMIPVSIYHNIVWWAYTVPFAAVSLPALLIHRINQVGFNRKRVINRITAKVETQEEHMKSLKELWG